MQAASKMGNGTAAAATGGDSATLSAQEAQLAASTMGRGSNAMDQLQEDDDESDEDDASD